MANLLKSFEHAIIGVFNSYHDLTVDGLNTPDDDHRMTGYIGFKCATTEQGQCYTDIPLENIRMYPSLVGEKHYALIPTTTLINIDMFIRLTKYISEMDQDYALSLKSFRLYESVYKLWMDNRLKKPIKQDAKKLLDLLWTAKSAHQAQASRIQSAQLLRADLLTEIVHLSELIGADLFVGKTPDNESQEKSKSLPDPRGPLSEEEFEVLHKRWERLRNRAIRSLNPDHEEREAASARTRELTTRIHALEAQRTALDGCFHPDTQSADLPCPESTKEVSRKKEQKTTEIAKLKLELQSLESRKPSKFSDREFKDSDLNATEVQLDPGIFLGRRGST